MTITSKDNELIYLGSIICQLLNDLEIIWQNHIELNKKILYDARLQLLLSLKGKYIEKMIEV